MSLGASTSSEKAAGPLVSMPMASASLSLGVSRLQPLSNKAAPKSKAGLKAGFFTGKVWGMPYFDSMRMASSRPLSDKGYMRSPISC